MTSRSPNNTAAADSGFTLLEMLITMAILVFISLGIYQSTTQTFKLRDVLMHEGDFYNGIRLSMEIMNRDIMAIYSPIMLIPPKKTVSSGIPAPLAPSPEDAEISSGDLAQASEFWGPAVDVTGLRPSRFQGTSSRLSFVSTSHSRVYKDSPESEFAKITYELQRDSENPEAPEIRDAQVLIKSESPNAFDLENNGKDDKARRVFPLLHGVKKLSFRFYRKEGDKWSTEWDSDKTDTKNIYPDIIEVSLETVGPSRLSFEGKYLFRPEVPLRALNPIF